jgi:hypothetical protein
VQITNFIIVIAVAGCVQLELGDEPAEQTNTVSSAVGVCAQKRTTVGPILTTGELAVAKAASGGLVAAWTGNTSVTASIVKLNTLFGVTSRYDLGAYGPRINGTLDLGTDALAAYETTSFGVVDMWKFPTDLSFGNYFGDYAGNPARKPFLHNPAGTQRAYIWSFQKTLIASHQDETGYASHGSFFDMPNTIIELSGDNGSGDSAVVWVEDVAGVRRCSAANVGFDTPSLPSLRGTQVVSSDCRRPRIATGPTNDVKAVVHSTASGAVQVHLLRSGSNTVRTLSTSGSGAKVQFAGSRFWIVWRDTGVAALRIATMDPVGTVTHLSTPGPSVAADNAFDLVRTSPSTGLLVAITPNALDFYTLCL